MESSEKLAVARLEPEPPAASHMESGESEGPQLGDGGESEGPQPGDSGESAEPQLEVSDESESPHPRDALLSKQDGLARGEPQISANVGA